MTTGRAATISKAISGRCALWAGIAIGTMLLQHVVQLAALTVIFGNVPNYWTGYNWPKNVWTIFSSTPSLSDSLSIAADEWLLEAGYMNRDFGHGIAEGAFSVMPSKTLIVLALGVLIATVFVLLLNQRSRTGVRTGWFAIGMAAAGAPLVAFTSASMHWVGACAEPSWVVGLTMAGLDVPLALWLEPAGPWFSAAGFFFLALAVILASAPETASAPTRGERLVRANPYCS